MKDGDFWGPAGLGLNPGPITYNQEIVELPSLELSLHISVRRENDLMLNKITFGNHSAWTLANTWLLHLASHLIATQ